MFTKDSIFKSTYHFFTTGNSYKIQKDRISKMFRVYRNLDSGSKFVCEFKRLSDAKIFIEECSHN